MRYLPLLFALLPSVLPSLFLPTALMAHSVSVTAQSTIAMLDHDFNEDGIIDRVMLHKPDGANDAMLVIWKGPDFDHPSVITQELIYSGSAGQVPELHLTDHGSLQVVSMNIGIGRNRWQQTLTIAYRDGRYMLAGFTYDWYDSLDLENSGLCDVNLFNGRGILRTGNESPKQHKIRTKMRAMPIANWDGRQPPECFDQ